MFLTELIIGWGRWDLNLNLILILNLNLNLNFFLNLYYAKIYFFPGSVLINPLNSKPSSRDDTSEGVMPIL
jgi:hypothetical protein